MSHGNVARKQRRRRELADARAYLDYSEQTDAVGCRNFRCTEEGQPEFAVWWKCPSGHREEVLYCAVHGPEHLDLAVRSSALVECGACGQWMGPLVEGL